MWRGALRLRTVLGARAGGAAAAVASGWTKRGLRIVKAPPPPPPPPLVAQVASVTQRRASGVGSSELREEEAAGAEHGQEQESPGQEPRICPDGSLPTFSIDHIVSLIRQENAKDICVIQLPPEMRYCDYFIIASGSSVRHLHAMARYMLKMHKHLKNDSQPYAVIEGKESDNWLCIDFGNIVVHFMLPETREMYELEKLWTLRIYDDQLAQMVTEALPDDFIFGLPSENELPSEQQ